ncbi:Glucosamine 6-phosphate N-acetyltransferase 1 [Hypsizygus marmoreus]|uniref:Glucosamine 6-phosphate N-acetyltransferase n=1 Tax=Hypsizygus marmoreus TaxID=39966 RepID=A0A369K429_HYPMA|nr:Glucosamine 6-phosphate N-acetyltransferase 1 [Hypsizygus marmoreus]
MAAITRIDATCFTPDSELDLLFSPDIISLEVKSALHPDVHIRPLASTDYKRGHLSVLSVLTAAPDPGEAAWVSHFEALRASGSTYYTLVIVDKRTDRIAGVGTVFIERKFQRGLSCVGHIEDIAVDEKQQGKKLGLRIIQALTGISENSGAYKTILNCSDKNIPFYQKCGFEKKENEMAKYTPVHTYSPRL